MHSLLTIKNLNKTYAQPVLRDFDFILEKGEVHALIGSNGAGKSTFARILTGLTPAGSGDIALNGKPFSPASRKAAEASGVAMVLQELNIIPTLSVAENISLSRLPSKAGILDRKTLRETALAALARVGLESLDPDTPAARLGVGQQQLVEIAGTLSDTASILILDEPSAALTGPEIEKLFENVARLRSRGVSVIYISHRMDEIARIADRVTVLRDGRRISTHKVSETGIPELVREMAGSELAERKPHIPSGKRRPALRVEDLRSGTAVKGVSFTVHEGEILGIAGLVGSGRTETLRAITAADRPSSGKIILGDNRNISPKSPADSAKLGIGLIPEDRKNEGLLLPLSITANTTISTLARHSGASVLNHSSERKATTEISDRLGIKRDAVSQPVSSLSGGNQQKVVIARWLLRDCSILLFDEPTRGIDIAARQTIYDTLDQLAAENRALVVVSSDLLELMSIAHRIIVMSDGRITGEFFPDTWTPESITAAAFAGYHNRSGASSNMSPH